MAPSRSGSGHRPPIFRFCSSCLPLLFFLLLTLQPSSQSIFSSILRNNLNRYLKNPLFTKSVAPGWPNEPFEHGGSGGGNGGNGGLVSPQGSQIAEFIKSQNKFTNEHLMETYGTNFNFDALLPEAFPGVISSLPTPAALSAPQPNSKGKSTSTASSQPRSTIFNATKHFYDDKAARQNSKSLTVSSSNINAYSDSSKLATFIGGNKNSNLYSTKANSSSSSSGTGGGHLYVDTPSSALRASPPLAEVHSSASRHHQQADHSAGNFENSLASGGNKYNQEKALNLKLEYGFRPLPPSQSKLPHLGEAGEEDFRSKDFTVTNSIQMNSGNGDPFGADFVKLDSLTEELGGLANKHTSGHKEDDVEEDSLGGGRGNNNIYSNIAATASTATSSNDDDDDEDGDEESERLRSMKSLAFEALNNHNHNHHNHHLDPADYKKYISYPMETESSDIHKLAFTGVESFHKPEHGSYADHDLGGFGSGVSNGGSGSGDSLAAYPHIKAFKSQGVDCARNAGYCEYDSSYPKEHVNSIISNCSAHLEDMYIEMPENLVDFTGYKTFIEVGGAGRFNGGSRNGPGGPFNSSLCDAERRYIRPSVGQDVDGHFYLILQSSFYFQQVPVEICSKPGLSCNVVGRCNSAVRCVQKYRTHMLISIDTDLPAGSHSGAAGGDHHRAHSSHSYHQHQHHQSHHQQPEKGSSSKGAATARQFRCPRMRMYRLPSSCVCELSRSAA